MYDYTHKIICRSVEQYRPVQSPDVYAWIDYSAYDENRTVPNPYRVSGRNIRAAKYFATLDEAMTFAAQSNDSI